MAMFRRTLGKISEPEAPSGDASSVAGSMSRGGTLTSARGSVDSQNSGPSLVGLFASRRLLRNLKNRINNRKTSATSSIPQVNKEPTYRMEPKKKFDRKRVQEAIKEVVDERLDGYKYNPKLCKTMCKVLSDEIKEKAKLCYFDRYKIVALVTLGEMNGQCLQAASRCAWDEAKDDFVTYNFQNQTMFCTVTVFGVYHE